MYSTRIKISIKILLPIFDLPQYVACNVRVQFSNSYKTTGCFRVLCAVVFVLLNSRREDKLFRKVRCY
jgi:hypothetical protein